MIRIRELMAVGLGTTISLPASGRVAAVWQANWGWGEEEAPLIKHTAQEINIQGIRIGSITPSSITSTFTIRSLYRWATRPTW